MAIDILQREANEISLVLLDVVMPEIDGYEVLELEKERADFFEGELSGITFTFRNSPPVLTLSDDGAKPLGISKVIADPLDSPEVKKISDGTLKRILDGVSRATSAAPDVKMNGHLLVNGKTSDCEFHCKTLWTDSDSSAYIGTAGIIFFE